MCTSNSNLICSLVTLTLVPTVIFISLMTTINKPEYDKLKYKSFDVHIDNINFSIRNCCVLNSCGCNSNYENITFISSSTFDSNKCMNNINFCSDEIKIDDCNIQYNVCYIVTMNYNYSNSNQSCIQKYDSYEDAIQFYSIYNITRDTTFYKSNCNIIFYRSFDTWKWVLTGVFGLFSAIFLTVDTKFIIYEIMLRNANSITVKEIDHMSTRIATVIWEGFFIPISTLITFIGYFQVEGVTQIMIIISTIFIAVIAWIMLGYQLIQFYK